MSLITPSNAGGRAAAQRVLWLLLCAILTLAVVITGRCTRRTPAPADDPFAKADRLQGLIFGGKLEAARALLDTLFSDPSPHPSIHCAAAYYFAATGQQAEAAWDSLAALRPNDPGIILGRATSATSARATAEAARHFDSAAAIYSTDDALARFVELRRIQSLVVLGESAEAQAAGTKLAAAAEREGDLRILGRVSGFMADEAMRAGNYEEAARLASRSVELSRTHDTRTILGWALRLRAQISKRRGDLPAARRDFEAALATGGLSPVSKALTLQAMAALEMDTWELVAAFDHLNQALAAARETGIRRLEASIEADLGLAEYRLGQLAPALRHYERALELGPPTARLMNRIGVIQANQGRFEEALASYSRGLELARNTGDRREEAALLGHLGILHARLGDDDRAETHFRAAIEGLGALGLDAEAAFHRHSLASLGLRQGRLMQAEAQLDSALAAFASAHEERGRARALSLLARCRKAGGEPDEAMALLDSAYAVAGSIGDGIGMAVAAQAKGDLLLDIEPSLAEKHFREVRTRALEIADPVLEAQAEIGLARAIARSGRTDLAATHYERALTRAEAVRLSVANDEEAAKFLAQASVVYHELVALHVQESRLGGSGTPKPAGKPDPHQADALGKAFAALERGRARGLLDRLGTDAALTAVDSKAALLRQQGEARVQALEARDPAKRQRAWARHDSLGAVLVEMTLAPQRSARLTVEPLGTEAIETRLARGEVLVAYSLAPDTSYALILDGRERTAVSLAGEGELCGRVSALLETVRHPPPRWSLAPYGRPSASPQQSLSRLARRLQEDLVRPLRLPPSTERLVILPDGILYHLPFEVLVDDAGSLVEKYEIVYAPSASTWARLGDASSDHRSPRRTLALADPIPVERSPSPELPGARREVESMRSALGASQVVVRQGEEATESLIKSEDARGYAILHLAAHGIADDRRPEECALELSPGGGEDGRLTANEVYGLDLGAGLVVLSGCETALGVDVRGEGVFGLARAFLCAGASAVVASLWRVPDGATAELMSQFYGGLATNASPAAALKAAKAGAASSGRHPFEWAGFVLIGSGGPQ